MPHRRRQRGEINREIVVSAALALADRDGLSGVTVRALATFLEAPPMTLYSAFSSKNELLNLMYFEVAGRMFAGVDGQGWVEGLRLVGGTIRTMLSEHPNWAPLLSRAAPPLTSEPREQLLAQMRDGGLSPEQAFSALSSVILGSLGLMLVEFALREGSGESGYSDRLQALKASVDDEGDDQSVVTRQALKRLDRYQLGEIHQQSLEALLVGIQAWIGTAGGT